MDDFKKEAIILIFVQKFLSQTKNCVNPCLTCWQWTHLGEQTGGEGSFCPSHPLKHFHPTPKSPASSLGLHKLAFCLLILFASPDFKGMTEWFSKDENTKDASCHLGKFTSFFFKYCVPQMMEQPCVFLLFLHTIHFLFSPEGYWHIVYIFTL